MRALSKASLEAALLTSQLIIYCIRHIDAALTSKIRRREIPLVLRACLIISELSIADILLHCSPPGANGGRYGSGCFHLSSRFSVSCSNILKMYCQLFQILEISIDQHEPVSVVDRTHCGLLRTGCASTLPGPSMRLDEPPSLAPASVIVGRAT